MGLCTRGICLDRTMDIGSAWRQSNAERARFAHRIVGPVLLPRVQGRQERRSDRGRTGLSIHEGTLSVLGLLKNS